MRSLTRENKSQTYKIVKRNKRRRAVYAVRSALLVAVFLLSVAFAGLKVSAVSIDAKSSVVGGYEKAYKSVMVEQNDCLWDIAERHMGVGYTDKRSYVEEIRQLNSLAQDDVHYGEYICVPYYQ